MLAGATVCLHVRHEVYERKQSAIACIYNTISGLYGWWGEVSEPSDKLSTFSKTEKIKKKRKHSKQKRQAYKRTLEHLFTSSRYLWEFIPRHLKVSLSFRRCVFMFKFVKSFNFIYFLWHFLSTPRHLGEGEEREKNDRTWLGKVDERKRSDWQH